MSSFEILSLSLGISTVLILACLLRHFARVASDVGFIRVGMNATTEAAKRHSDAIRELEKRPTLDLSNIDEAVIRALVRKRDRG